MRDFGTADFPKSLRAIGTTNVAGAFCWAKLPHVELPETLEELGCYAFASSEMASVRIPKGLRSIYNRQFKGSYIGTLYLPEEFRAADGFCDNRDCETGEQYAYIESMLESIVINDNHNWETGEQYGYIRSMLVNNVIIKALVFE